MKYVMQYKIFKIMVNSQFYRNIETKVTKKQLGKERARKLIGILSIKLRRIKTLIILFESMKL